jgi:uncharacterized protein YegL
MRKFPVYVMADISESMAGENLTILEKGMRSIVSDLMTDPHALETVWISVLGFAGRSRTLAPMTELADFMPPHLPVGGGTALGAALTHLMDAIDHDVRRSTPTEKGDWRPLIFPLTDGVPTHNPEPGARAPTLAARLCTPSVARGGLHRRHGRQARAGPDRGGCHPAR